MAYNFPTDITYEQRDKQRISHGSKRLRNVAHLTVLNNSKLTQSMDKFKEEGFDTSASLAYDKDTSQIMNKRNSTLKSSKPTSKSRLKSLQRKILARSQANLIQLEDNSDLSHMPRHLVKPIKQQHGEYFSSVT